MTARIFLDTNILVYAYDVTALTKSDQALDLIDGVGAARAGIISAQVLSEFFNTTTRKIRIPLTTEEAAERVEALLQTWTIVPVTELVVLEAIRGVRQHQMSFWDAQIWSAARLNQATILLSEDFQDGSVIEGVRIKNPFYAKFRLEDWL